MQRRVCELAGRFDPARFEVEVAALHDAGWAPTGEAASAAAGFGVRVLDRRPWWGIASLRSLIAFLRRRRFDVVHTYLPGADLLARLACGPAGVRHLIHTADVARWQRWPGQYAYARLFRRPSDRVVCASAWACGDHARCSGLPRWAYRVIPPGVDLDAWARHEPTRQALRAQWGIDPEATVFAFAGELNGHCGIDLVLSAVSHLAARGAPKWLIIVGDGPKRYMVDNYIAHGEGKQYARHLGGPNVEMRGVLSAADVFLIPRLGALSPPSAAEAMAASCALIAARQPALAELAVPEETAVVIDPDDRWALAEAVERLAFDDDLRSRLGRRAREVAARRCRIDRVVAAHSRLYLDLVAGRA